MSDRDRIYYYNINPLTAKSDYRSIFSPVSITPKTNIKKNKNKNKYIN